MFYCVATCCIAVGAAPLCFGAQVLQLLIKKRKRNMDGSLLGSNAAARMVCSGPCSYTLPFYMYTLPASAAGPHSCNLVRHAATSCTIPLQPYCKDFVREKQVGLLYGSLGSKVPRLIRDSLLQSAAPPTDDR